MMLTTTYSIVMLNGEQQKARNLLSGLERYLNHDVGHDAESADPVWLQRTFAKLLTAYTYSCERKVELFVIPLIRNLSPESSSLLASLDSTNQYCARILEYVYNQVKRSIGGGHIDVETFVAAIWLYCKQANHRFSIEEEELFPLAHRVLSEDDWFQIASKCLSRVDKAHGNQMQVYTPRVSNRFEKQRFLH